MLYYKDCYKTIIINIMKTLKCDVCEHEVQGATFMDWCMALLPHYKEAHPEIINNPDLGAEEKAKWMADNKVRFDAA